MSQLWKKSSGRLLMEFPTPDDIANRGFVLTGFIDPGGSIDDYFLTVLKTHIPTAHIQVVGAMHWLLDEKRGIDFGKIRNDIAKLHMRNYFNMIGCELNNFGRGEVQSMRREYHINMYGVNTSGKVNEPTQTISDRSAPMVAQDADRRLADDGLQR